MSWPAENPNAAAYAALGVALGSPNNKTLVLWTGNSLVAGTATTPAPAVLQTTLGATYAVVNLGASGETAAQIRDRFVEYADAGYTGFYVISGPDAVNSVRTGKNAASIEADLALIYAAAKAARADCTVIALTDTPWKNYVDATPAYSWDAGKQAITDAVNAWKVAKVGGAANIDIVVDAYADFEDPAALDALKAAYDDGEHLHYPQAGYNRLAALVAAAVTFTADAAVRVEVRGDQAVIDQDLSKQSSAVQYEGIKIGSQQSGFGAVHPLFHASHDGEGGARAIGVGREALLDPTRSVQYDITWRHEWLSQSAGAGGYRCAGIYVPSRFYGSGYGALALCTTDTGALVERAIIMPDGKVGINMGGYDPPRQFVISDGAQKNFEFDVISGESFGFAIDRDTDLFIPRRVWASQFEWKLPASGASLKYNVNGLEISNPAGGTSASFPMNVHIESGGLLRRVTLPTPPSLGAALPTDGSATNAAIATMLNALRQLGIDLGYATA